MGRRGRGSLVTTDAWRGKASRVEAVWRNAALTGVVKCSCREREKVVRTVTRLKSLVGAVE